MAVTRCGLRRSSSDAGTAAAGPVKGCENAVISSITVGLVTGREGATSPAHPNLRPQIAALLQRVMRMCSGSATQSSDAPQRIPVHVLPCFVGLWPGGTRCQVLDCTDGISLSDGLL